MNTAKNYYVYCYINPLPGKGFGKEFYYGKGKERRKWAHLSARGKSKKAKKMRQIRAAEKKPIIRVIAADLTQDQALLVEAALIWKLGEELTNKIAGHYIGHFRPQNTMDRELEGFDFSHRSHFFNVGEHFDDGANRNWDDCYKYGFVSTGYAPEKRDPACQLRKGDVVLAYISKHGYVGIGKVTVEAVPACKFRIGKKSLKQMRLVATNMCHHYDNPDKCEYVTRVKWEHREKRKKALWKKGLYYAIQIRASLEDQRDTQRYIEEKWGVKFADLLE
jgi:hypothetical protein